LRWIHWPTTARQNEPYVQIFDSEPSSDYWLVLDLDAEVQIGEDERNTEEYGIILAASLVNHFNHMGKAIGLISHGEQLLWHVPAVGDAHLWKILRSLATVRPGRVRLKELLESIRESIDRQVSMVIITANASPEWLATLDILRQSGIIPTVIILDPSTFGSAHRTENIRDHLIRMGITHYIITADILDQPEEPEERPWDWLLFPTRQKQSTRERYRGVWKKGLRYLRTLGLVSFLLWGMTSTLGDAIPGVDESFLWFMTGSGVLINGLLMVFTIPWWISGLVSGGLGIALSMIRVGRMEGLLIEIGSQLANLIQVGLRSLVSDSAAPETEALHSSFMLLGEKLTLLGSRLWEWLAGMVQGESYFDPVAVVILWGITVWIATGWALYGVVKLKDPILAGAPAFLLVAISSGITNQPGYVLAMMLGAMILQSAFVRYEMHEREWEDGLLHYENTIRPRVAIAGLFVAVALMVGSILSPSISFNSIRDAIRNALNIDQDSSSIADSLGIDTRRQVEARNPLDALNTETLPNKHLLGSGSELSEILVMTVKLETWPGVDFNVEGIIPPERIYLRNLSYDRYTGQGWASEYEGMVEYRAGQMLLSSWPENYHVVRQSLEVTDGYQGLLYAVGIPFRTDKVINVAWRSVEDRSDAFDLFGVMLSETNYRVDSIMPLFSETELRSAGRSYPDWIEERYLALPPTVPDDVLALARDLTAVEPTPYDRALSLENYLRELDYSLDVSLVPAGRDVTQYFLFTLGEGYCDYFATAMVVLSRAAGIPARLITGYVAEQYDQSFEAYLVTENQAHAWAELYFPEFGWILFEPTPGRAEIERPVEPLPTIIDSTPLDMEPIEDVLEIPTWVWPVGVVGLLMLVVGGFAVTLLLSDFYLSLLSVGALIPRVYGRFLRQAKRVGIPLKLYHTPNDVVAISTQYIGIIGRTSQWDEWLMEANRELEVLVEAIILHVFSPRGSSSIDTKSILRAHKKLRPRLWLLWFLGHARNYPIVWSLIWQVPPPAIIKIDG
jgi:transglutaminase-like putative cysteine protease